MTHLSVAFWTGVAPVAAVVRGKLRCPAGIAAAKVMQQHLRCEVRLPAAGADFADVQMMALGFRQRLTRSEPGVQILTLGEELEIPLTPSASPRYSYPCGVCGLGQGSIAPPALAMRRSRSMGAFPHSFCCGDRHGAKVWRHDPRPLSVRSSHPLPRERDPTCRIGQSPALPPRCGKLCPGEDLARLRRV